MTYVDYRKHIGYVVSNFHKKNDRDGTSTVTGKHLSQYHPLLLSGAPVGRVVCFTLPALASFPLSSSIFVHLPFLFFLFSRGLHMLGDPTYGPIHKCWGSLQPMTYGHMGRPSLGMCGLVNLSTNYRPRANKKPKTHQEPAVRK